MNQPSHGYVKIAMIPLLLGTLYWVFPGKSADPAVIAIDPTHAISAISLTESEQYQTFNETELASKTQWPEFLSGKLENVNPFDRQMIFPEPLMKNLPAEPMDSKPQALGGANTHVSASKLVSSRIQAVFQSPQGIAALIGERVVRIGDRLEDGTQVIGITPEQLIFESPHER